MSHLPFSFSIEIFRIVFIFILIGLFLLIFQWHKVIPNITKKRSTEKMLNKGILVVGWIIIIVSVIFLFIMKTSLIQVTDTKPQISQIPSGAIFTLSTDTTCSTSKATGNSTTKIFQIAHLVGDGKTDNTPAIQTAIAQAGNAGGGIVKLPAGTFLINGHLVMSNNVTLEGAGPTTILKAGPKFLNVDPNIGYSIVSTNGSSNVTLRNFLADQQGNKLNANQINRFLGYVIHVYQSTNTVVDGVYVRNPFAYAIMAEDSTKFCIKNSNTQVDTNGKYDQLDGIHVLNSSFGDVLNNYIDQGYGADGDDGLAAHTIDGSVHDITYAGNKVRGGRGGSGMQLALTNATDTIYNIKIQNNEFWNSPRGIRTGYYGENGETGGSVHDIIIGGSSSTGNYIHDNTFNDVKVGDAINIYGNGIDPYNITVTNNQTCKAGTISVGKGKNNVVKNNSGC